MTPSPPPKEGPAGKDPELARLKGALRAFEERYVDLYDLAPVGLLTVRGDGIVLEANLTLARMFGVDKESLCGVSLREFVHPDDHGAWESHHSRVLSQPGSLRGELRFVRADKTSFWARVECRLGHGQDGAQFHRASLSDITDLMRVRQELLSLRAAVDQARDGLAFADMRGIVRFVNRAWAREHGYAPEELVGRPLSVFHTPEQLDRDVRPFNRKVLELGSWSGEVGHVHRDGSEFTRWMSTVLLHDADDKVMGFVGMTVDPQRFRAAPAPAPAQRGS